MTLQCKMSGRNATTNRYCPRTTRARNLEQGIITTTPHWTMNTILHYVRDLSRQPMLTSINRNKGTFRFVYFHCTISRMIARTFYMYNCNGPVQARAKLLQTTMFWLWNGHEQKEMSENMTTAVVWKSCKLRTRSNYTVPCVFKGNHRAITRISRRTA